MHWVRTKGDYAVWHDLVKGRGQPLVPVDFGMLHPGASLFTRHKGKVGLSVFLGACYLYYRTHKKNSAKSNRLSSSSSTASGSKRARKYAKVDKTFLKQLSYILHKSIGSLWSREGLIAISLAATLVARTVMSLLITMKIADMIRTLTERNLRGSIVEISKFAVLTIPAAVLNSLLKYQSGLLSLYLRENVNKALSDRYFKNMNYYKLNKLEHGNVSHADQIIADDVAKFSHHVGEVYTQLLKPSVDFIVFSLKLKKLLGSTGPMGMYSWFLVATTISARVLPSYGRLMAKQQALEGDYRYRHAKLIDNAEMVAFLGGEKPERSVLDHSFQEIHRHVTGALLWKGYAGVVTGYVTKYFASVVGFVMIAYPLYAEVGDTASYSPSQITSYYIESSRILEGLADAVMRLFDVHKEISLLSGLTERVYQMLYRLEHPPPSSTPLLDAEEMAAHPPTWKHADYLAFDHVSVVLPDGRLLVRNLTLQVPHGRRVIITGENGAGKSSMFRVMRGLWPLVQGTITLPPPHSMFFLSQENFTPVGTLRDTVIYPQCLDDLLDKSETDESVLHCLELARLATLTVEGQTVTLNDVRDWDKALSPGQKQRLGFARMFYHRPRYAVLDECTNGIAPDVEEELYGLCTTLGISVFSISHKTELKRYHDYELHFKGLEGDDAHTYTFTPVGV